MKRIFSSILILFILLINFILPISVFASSISLVSKSIPPKLYKYDALNFGGQYYDFTFTFKIASNPPETGSLDQVYGVVYFDADINGQSVSLDSAILKSGTSETPAKTANNNKVMYVANIIASEHKGETIERTVRIPMALLFSITKENNVPLNWKIYNANNYNEIYASGTIKLADDPVSVTPQIGVAQNKTVYQMLAPLPGISCMDWSGNNTAGCLGNNVGDYLNIIFKLGIGIAAALAVIMLIINGVTYMGDESVFGKTEAKSKMFSAVLGLLIALGAWALLNTISPALTGKGGVNISTADIKITDFGVSGGTTFDGKPISVNFNKKAYPAAKIASQKTGVDTAFILAVFSQETGSGKNTGRCTISNAKANMYPEDIVALKTITTELSRDINITPVSCSLLKSDGSFDGHGGAIGLTQFRPATWLENREAARVYLGHMPDPWVPEDALMMTAVYLKKMGGATNQQEAACKYFGGPGISCGTNAGIANYGNSVLGKKVSIQKQIDDSIKKGEIN